MTKTKTVVGRQARRPSDDSESPGHAELAHKRCRGGQAAAKLKDVSEGEQRQSAARGTPRLIQGIG